MTILARAGLALCDGIAVVYVAPRFWGVPHKLPASRDLDPHEARATRVDRASASTACGLAGGNAGPVRSAVRPPRGYPPRGTGGQPPH